MIDPDEKNRKPSKKPPIKKVVKAPVKQQSAKPQPKPVAKPGVKTNKSIMDVKPTGLTRRQATRIVDETYGGNVQKAWHDYAPGAIKEYTRQGLPVAQARAQAMDDFGFTNDPEVRTGPKLYSNYWFEPDYSPEPEQQYYAPREPDYGGRGGGGGYTAPTPPIPEMKIRTTAGLRRSPYWESDDPYNQVFEPRFVVLGNQNAW
jgi:hypothetical protein